MVLEKAGEPLRLTELAVPTPGPTQVLVDVHACAVCRTDLHVVDGELTQPKLPLIPGHEIVGTVAHVGEGVERFRIGERVGVPWLGWTCSRCCYCRNDQENLCDRAQFTGYTLDGGYAVGADVRTEQPRDSHAPLVHVAARRTAAEVEAICAAVERALVEELDLADGNVFVTVRPVYALDETAGA